MIATQPATQSLAGRVAVVTGASHGIGRSLAMVLARHGACVVGSSRSGGALATLVDDVRAAGSDGRAVVADATDPQAARRPVHVALEEFGRLDILVNNVGGRLPDSVADGDPFSCGDDIFLHLLTLNLLSAWWTTSAALPAMRDRQYGRIINIGSGNSTRAGGSLPYTAAKHGVVGLTKSLANSVARYGITVNCLCPGWTATPHNDWEVVGERMGGLSAREARGRAESENAQHRVLDPEELGPLAVLLASEASAGMTGQVISVDGGWKL